MMFQGCTDQPVKLGHGFTVGESTAYRFRFTALAISVSMLLVAGTVQAQSAASNQSRPINSSVPSGQAAVPATQPTGQAAGQPATVQAEIRLPAGSLADALTKFGEQSGLQIVYDPKLVRGVRARAVVGRLTVDQALRQLLQGTGITWVYAGGDTLVLKAGALPATESQSEPVPSSVPAETTEFERIEVRGKMPEVLVAGARSINADIPRTENDIQPYVVFSAEDIERSNSINLEDFLKRRLSMNATSTTFSQNSNTGSGDNRGGSNISRINLRGLGVDETLVLINGRRQPGVSNINRSGTIGQPDLNGIPINSIERIEILPATAAGIYGGGATGGVINIILKTNFTGFDVTAGYDNTFETDSGSKRISITGGKVFDEGRTSVTFTVSASEDNPMFVRDRNFAQKARERAVANNDEAYTESWSQLPAGYTTNIRSAQVCDANFVCTMPNLRLKPEFGGADLGSVLTHVPVGYTGNPLDLLANAGRLNLQLADDLSNAGRSLINNPRTNSINLTIDRKFTDNFSMFANISRNENHGNVYQTGLQNSGYTIAADAPNNPFVGAINVSVPFPGFSYLQKTDSEALNAVLGAQFSLPHEWRGQIEGSYGRSRVSSSGGNAFIVNNVYDVPPWMGGHVIREGIVGGIARGAIDVLRDLNQVPLDLSNYMYSRYPNQTQTPSDNVGKGAVLRLSGPVAQLPAGPLVLSTSLEHREDEAKGMVQSILQQDDVTRYYFYPSRSTSTDSFYLESSIPLVSDINALRWVKLFELQTSMRREKSGSRSVEASAIEIGGPSDRPESVEYTSSDTTATGYTAGFRFAPSQDVMLRASFSHGFLPPSISQISPHFLDFATETNFFSDPLRNYELIGSAGPAVIVYGGNPNLKPETSDSISVGLIVTPRFMPGFRLSADLTQITKKNEISGVDTFALLMDPEMADRLYPGRIVRGDPLGDGLPGPVTYFDGTLINIERTRVKALDIQADYSVESGWGLFNFYTTATKQLEYSRKLDPESPLQEYVGFRDGPLEWRGNVGIDWFKGPLSLGWNMQYFDKYLVYNFLDSGTRDTYVRNQGGAYIRSQRFHDISFKYRFGDVFEGSWASGLTIAGGIQNILNTAPRLDVNMDTGYSTYGDPRMRRFRLELTKSF
ncbi:TonB-dependent receptor [Pseudoxanthomonas putridarboris]|uniref:TonB-dependent receptor n=1 Tax=Pseudoxanthomonas putridarboris TaxID=752605 RepID=A0ABU9IXC6_9GAMM